MNIVKDSLEIAKDLLEILVLSLTAWQLGKPKNKKKNKSKRRKNRK